LSAANGKEDMILNEIQNYLSHQGRASLAQMQVHFGIHADALRGMLNRLIRKGRVQKLPTPKRCHHCVDCSQESLEFYEWITDEPAAAINQQECCSHGSKASVQ
jgi:predicted transcriptional regulator